MNKLEETTKIIRKDTKALPMLKGIELHLLDNGFIPTIDTQEEKNLYMAYFQNKYTQTPLQAKETKILYQTLYLLMSQYEI